MVKTQRPDSRQGTLSREKIVDAAIEILDVEGEGGLTFKALTNRLKTGSGAIYWHVADKSELLMAATDSVVTRAMDSIIDTMPPRDAVRAIGLAVFDALDTHPWIGTVLADPLGPASLQIFEGIGGRLLALGVPAQSQFDVWSALVSYILGIAAQEASKARVLKHSDEDRTRILRSVADHWAQLDPKKYPFLQQTASQLADHDDRAQYLAGIDLILAGIELS